MMQRKMPVKRLKRITLLSIVSVLIIVLLYFSFMYLKCMETREKSWECEFVVELETNSSDGYLLEVPIPIFERESRGIYKISEVMSSVEVIDGDAEIMIVSTEYGDALRINGTGSVTIQASNKGKESMKSIDYFERYLANGMSMRNVSSPEREPTFFIYSTNEQSNISLSCYLDYKSLVRWYNGFGENTYNGIITGQIDMAGQIMESGWVEIQGHDYGGSIS